MRYLVSQYHVGSPWSDKLFVYAMLDELACQLREHYPTLAKGANALERNLQLKLHSVDEDHASTSSADVSSSIASCGGTSAPMSGVSGAACGAHTYDIPSDAEAAQSGSYLALVAVCAGMA